MKTVKIIFSCFIAGFVLLALFTTNTKPDAVSEIDNRRLVKWKGDIDSYFQDRIGFRDRMINFYTVCNDFVFNEMVHPTYEYGKHGYVFFRYGNEANDEEFIDLFCRYLKQVQEYCTQRGVEFLFVYNPSKTSVYAHYLAKGYHYKGIVYSRMKEKLSEYGIRYVDNLSYLKDLSKTLQVFNPKYDAGHWNDVGAFYATNNMLDTIAKDFPAVKAHELSDFNMDTVLQKSLPVSLFVINEKVPEYTLREDKAKGVSEKYHGIELHPKYQYFASYQTDNNLCPNVVFFHGSYYNSRNKFYQDRFHQVTGIHNYQNFLNFDYYFNLFRPDCVIFETAEYTLHTGFFDKEVLRTKHLNLPYDSVKQKPHERFSVSDLQDYREEDREELVKVSFSVPEDMAFGYLFVGKTEYDLQLNGATASVTLLKSDYIKEAAEGVLFPAR